MSSRGRHAGRRVPRGGFRRGPYWVEDVVVEPPCDCTPKSDTGAISQSGRACPKCEWPANGALCRACGYVNRSSSSNTGAADTDPPASDGLSKAQGSGAALAIVVLALLFASGKADRAFS